MSSARITGYQIQVATNSKFTAGKKTVKVAGAIVSGPIPLPTHKRIFTVNRSTFVNKKAREQFELNCYKRLIDIYSSTAKTVDALMKLELPSGVEVEIKV